ncbi:MAG: hypothetical protein WDZ48_08525 [Pirellulales bacterium]
MDSALVDQTCDQFLGQWKRLVSTTNWEKGRIICQWREALASADSPPSQYSDEAWSRRVGNVTPQHVGRLRRVFERFAAVRDDYPGLHWSHFQAALDWDEAELWLEGAVQNDWSIAEMRHKRWETRGALEAEEPSGDDAPLEIPWDDDAEPPDRAGEVTSGTLGVVHAPERSSDKEDEDDDDVQDRYDSRIEAPIVRPFAALPPLPPDVNDAFEAYKLCILRHKLAGWDEISRDDLILSLDALKELALAPADV